MPHRSLHRVAVEVERAVDERQGQHGGPEHVSADEDDGQVGEVLDVADDALQQGDDEHGRPRPAGAVDFGRPGRSLGGSDAQRHDNGDDHISTTTHNRTFDVTDTVTMWAEVSLPDTELGDEEMYQQVKFQVTSNGVTSPWTAWELSPVQQFSK